MEEFIETFHIDWKLMLAQLLNFAVVFLVFYFLAAKPLRKLMSERTKEIDTGLTNAKDNALLLEKTKKEYELMIRKARVEADKIYDQNKKDAEKKKAVMIEDAKNEVKSMIERGRISLEAEKVKMLEEAKREIVNLAMLSAEKILKSKKDLNNL